MALGTPPSARVKARAKADPLRRVIHARTFEGIVLDDSRSTPDQANTGENTRATSILPEERSGQQTPATEEPPILQQAFSTPVTSSEVEAMKEIIVEPAQPASPPSAKPLPGSSFSQPTTPGTYHPPPPETFIGQPFLPDPPRWWGPPLHRFDSAIKTASFMRPDMWAVIEAIDSAAKKDPEFKFLLAAQAQTNGPAGIVGGTPEQTKALRKKVRRLKKAWHHGRAAIENSTFGALEQQPAPSPLQNESVQSPQQSSAISRGPDNNMTLSANSDQSPNITKTMDYASPVQNANKYQQTSTSKSAATPAPTLKLRLTQKRPSPATPQTLSNEPSKSPLRQMSNLSDLVMDPNTPAQQLTSKHDSDLSSVDEDITNQDQSTFLK